MAKSDFEFVSVPLTRGIALHPLDETFNSIAYLNDAVRAKIARLVKLIDGNPRDFQVSQPSQLGDVRNGSAVLTTTLSWKVDEVITI